MKGDVLTQLALENPRPEELPALPIGPILARLDEDPPAVFTGSRRAQHAPQLAFVAVAAALTASVALIVVAHPRPGRQHPTRATLELKRLTAYLTADQFGVFGRPQTARDRSLPVVLRRATRLGGLGRGPLATAGAIPKLTRYTQTISGGREVFLTVRRPSSFPVARQQSLTQGSVLEIGVIIVQPQGHWTEGQPVVNPTTGGTPADAYLTAKTGRGGCTLDTYYDIVPDRVARIRWQFGRQDPLGYVYKAPLTVNMTARGNVAATTIPVRASCDEPTTITLYGQHGQVLSQTGNPADLDRITRPIRHGNPFAYRALMRRPPANSQ